MTTAIINGSTIKISVTNKPATQKVVVSNTVAVQKVVVGIGIKGDPGDKGVVQRTAIIALSGQRVLALETEGFVYADPNNLEHIHRIAGISISAFNAGVMATAQCSGLMEEPTWNWILGIPIFLGLNGILTQSIPDSIFNLIVGTPVTSTKILIAIKQPYIN